MLLVINKMTFGDWLFKSVASNVITGNDLQNCHLQGHYGHVCLKETLPKTKSFQIWQSLIL